MQIIKLNKNKLDIETLKRIGKSIESGKVVVFPSDTTYGIATNPTIKDSIAKINLIKNRTDDKILSYIFKDISQIKDYVEADNEQIQILNKNLPGPFTFGINNKYSKKLMTDRIGIRIPDFLFTKELSKYCEVPYTSTSANVSGFPSTYSIDEFLDQLKHTDTKPDYIIDYGELPKNKPSTVCDISDPRNPIILREGEKIPNLEISNLF